MGIGYPVPREGRNSDIGIRKVPYVESSIVNREESIQYASAHGFPHALGWLTDLETRSSLVLGAKRTVNIANAHRQSFR